MADFDNTLLGKPGNLVVSARSSYKTVPHSGVFALRQRYDSAWPLCGRFGMPSYCVQPDSVLKRRQNPIPRVPKLNSLAEETSESNSKSLESTPEVFPKKYGFYYG